MCEKNISEMKNNKPAHADGIIWGKHMPHTSL